MTALATPEIAHDFPCFGGRAAVVASGRDAESLTREVRHMLGDWHRTFTRFDTLSALSLLNSAPADRVRASETMCRFVTVALDSARRTGGLVDPTLAPEMIAAGYDRDRDRELNLEAALRIAPPRAPAGPDAAARWRDVAVDPVNRIVVRPPGVQLDSGGVAKGLFADLAAEVLRDCESYVVDCCGDLRIGGLADVSRPVRVDDPFGRGVLHEWERGAGGVATSGIGRRAWLDSDGRPAHHLLDPATGRPAYTGVVQATALAPTAVEAEVLAKAALLSGPDAGRDWLRPHGGLLVFDDGSHEVIG